MTAREMFEKLGYKQMCNNSKYIIYAKRNIELDFEIERRVLTVTDLSYIFTPKELQAINKQAEELGWYNGRI